MEEENPQAPLLPQWLAKKMYTVPTCTICLDELDKDLSIISSCEHAHVFHRACLESWFTARASEG